MAVTYIRRETQLRPGTANRLVYNADATGIMSDLAAITGSRALESDSNGLPVASAVTSTELGYVSGVTSAIQTQIDGKQATGDYITDLTGDVTASGPGSVAATLATVNSNVGEFGDASTVPTFTVNGKGLITAASENAVVAPAGTLTGTTLNATVVSSSLTSLGTQAEDLNMGTHKITGVVDPISDQDAATKFYVDSVAAGLDPKESVRLGTTTTLDASAGASSYFIGSNTAGATNGVIFAVTQASGTYVLGETITESTSGTTGTLEAIDNTTAATVMYISNPSAAFTGGETLTGAGGATASGDSIEEVDFFSADSTGAMSNIDGTAPTANDRILVKDESDAKQNGIYEVDIVGTASLNWALRRAADQDGSPANEVSAGNFTFVEQGTTNADSGWVVQGDGTLTLNTDNIDWVQFSGAGSITAGSGLSKTGSTLNVGDVDRGVQVNADDVEIDGSEMVHATGGLEESANSWQIKIKPDSTTGATVAPITIGTNGAGMTVDNSTITHSTGTLSVGSISTSKISDIISSTPSSGDLLIYDGTDSYDNQAMSGDATISNAGVLTLASDVLKEADIVTREVPTGDLNGANVTYVLANTPIAGTEHVYLNGILQNEGAGNDYTISGTTITFANAPESGDVVLVSYWK